MTDEPLIAFSHPQGAFRLRYPADWEHLEKDNAQSCGFGPRDRDDVGLWISILPLRLDTDKLSTELRPAFEQALGNSEAVDIRADVTLRHQALKADISEPREAGHFWIVAGGDLVLFASSQVPAAERARWNPQFERLMASLEITRDDELLMRKVSDQVMRRMRQAHPEQNYEWHEDSIRGRDHRVNLGNVHREVLAAPQRQYEIIGRFVEALDVSSAVPFGHELWEEVFDKVLPVLKPLDYVKAQGPASRIVNTEWLSDLHTVYAIRGKLLRFITEWDLTRWHIDMPGLRRQAIQNLALLPWPDRLEGSREPGGGRLIVVTANDGFDSSRLLHPDLHHLFSGPLGSPFLAGIPDRDTLIAFSNDRGLKGRIARQIHEDYLKSPHPITARLFLVSAGGIAPAGIQEN